MRYLIIDAFAERTFAGNPAAVVWIEQPEHATDDLLSKIAAEFNLAETAFVHGLADGGVFGLRWFTPACEVALCGHATLAAAHALWRWEKAGEEEPIHFDTRFSGRLTCRRDGERIAMDFPETPAKPCEAPANAASVLGVEGPVHCVGSVNMNMLLILPDESQVLAAAPDMRTLATWHNVGVIISSASDRSDVDFVSRFFAPSCGIDEDPVTGSAHCTLAPYWSEQLGKTSMIAEQLSKRRGRLQVNRRSRDGAARVELIGSAVTVMEGRLLGCGG